jgi:hypothetical protein
MRVHDPYVEHWYELESQEDYPSPGTSWKRFFRNQEHLNEMKVSQNLQESLKGVEAVIFAVPHKQYIDLTPDEIVNWVGGPVAIIDAFGMLSDEKIRRYFELGCEVKALGRGHVQRIKKEVKG